MGYELMEIHYSGGSHASHVPTATVRIKTLDGSVVTEAATSETGNGPVDAAFKAIQRAIKINVELVEFFVSSIGPGSEAIGKVIVRIKDNDDVYEDSGLSTDIIIASAEAFVNALNNKVAFEATVVAHTV